MVRNHFTSTANTAAAEDEPFSPATCAAILTVVVAGSWLLVAGVLHAVAHFF
jgi:hypothetical protein